MNHDDHRGHNQRSPFYIVSVCVLIPQYYLPPSCVPCFVWTAIRNQPIGTAGRRAPAPRARLARPVNHSPGNQSTGTHGGKTSARRRARRGGRRKGGGGRGGGTTRPVRERERERERSAEREQANERRGSRAAPSAVPPDCTSSGVCGLAGLYTSKQNKERGSTVV